ncbi:hypothetical protein C8R45DRAFT_926031 [Mycena sanguinolenta]|nr:hypothetical protein C8R45DRAFT_926031 [Mycena sanguinolenta]
MSLLFSGIPTQFSTKFIIVFHSAFSHVRPSRLSTSYKTRRGFKGLVMGPVRNWKRLRHRLRYPLPPPPPAAFFTAFTATVKYLQVLFSILSNVSPLLTRRFTAIFKQMTLYLPRYIDQIDDSDGTIFIVSTVRHPTQYCGGRTNTGFRRRNNGAVSRSNGKPGFRGFDNSKLVAEAAAAEARTFISLVSIVSGQLVSGNENEGMIQLKNVLEGGKVKWAPEEMIHSAQK